MCNSEHATLSRLFGYQVEDSGTVDLADQIARRHTDPHFTSSNPLGFASELGFLGYRYGLDARKVLSPFYRGGYGGIYPTKEQPRIQAPQPFEIPVVL